MVASTPMRSWMLAGLALAACGDNIPSVGPPLAQAEHLFIGAHMDDETIFMQPEVVDATRNGSVTTVFVASGDPVKGDDHAIDVFEWALGAYAAVSGSSDWDCGYLMVEGSPIHHCRLRDRPISIIGLELPDGGMQGERRDSFLHLVEGEIESMPILGRIRGVATNDSIVAELASIIATTAPTEIHSLDVSATHGRDNSSHLFAASYAFWSIAALGYTGPVTWHRGYNVGVEPITLDGEKLEQAKWMLGFFEACYYGCAPCGTTCTMIPESHDTYLRRQYASERRLEVAGKLASNGVCLAVAMTGRVETADCADAPRFQLDREGRLSTGNLCLASTPEGAVVGEPCSARPAQYWLLDDEGFIWNGRLPQGVPGMEYDHVRCLSAEPLGAPTCGASHQPRWQFL